MSKFVKNLKQETIEKGLELLDACLDDLAFARHIISKDPSYVDWKDNDTGVGLLHNLVYNELDKPVRLLLQHGANPNITNKVGYTIYRTQNIYSQTFGFNYRTRRHLYIGVLP